MLNTIVMKKFTLILALIFYGYTTEAQLQEESFGSTSIPAGWTANNATSGCSWQFGYNGIMPNSGPTITAEFPTGAALFDDSVCGGLSEDFATLTGPEIDLSGDSNAAIEVIYNLQVFADRGEFIIEVFDGNLWQQVFFQDEDSPRNTGTNQSVSLDVTPFTNSQFKVRFTYNDEGLTTAYALGIDSYKLISSAVASVEDLDMLGFNYYPNPADNLINLTALENIKEVNIFNILGQRVIKVQPSETNTQLNLSSLPVGTYIVKVQVDDKLGSFKILKK
jgi:hypothetical protein